MDATNIAIFVGGILQPYVQESIIRNRLSGRSALLATALIAFAIAALATWVVGGFSGMIIPTFTLADPSPLLAYLWPKFATVYALASLVFHGTESTPADPHVVVGTAATPPAPPVPIAPPQ